MKKLSLLAIILLVVGLLAAYPQGKMQGRKSHQGKGFECQQGRGNHEMRRGKRKSSRIDFILRCEEIELTEKQKEELISLKNEIAKERIDSRAGMEKMRIDKRESMMKEEFSAAKKITATMFEQKKDHALKMIDYKEKVLKILSEEQKEKLKELHKKYPRKRNK